MLPSFPELFEIIGHYKYWIIFPIAIFEGPIMIIISGFLVNLGVLNGYIAYAVLVVADMVGDSLYYLIGRYWRYANWIKKLGRFVGYDEESEQFLEEHFRRHKIKTFIIGKFAHGLGGSIQIAFGIARFRYFEFITLSFFGTLPKALILIYFGYVAGSYYEKINGYFHYIALFTVGTALILLFFVVSNKIKRNFLKRK